MDPSGSGGSSSSSIGISIFNTLSLFAWRMTTLVLGLGTVVATILYFKQDSMLYFPEIGGIPRRPAQNPRRYRSPAEHQIPFESHRIECDDGVFIHSWLLLRETQTASRSNKNTLPTLVFFHGNAGNIGLRLPNALQMLQYLNANILMVEYRGYGDSDSVPPNEAGLKLDAVAALRFISSHPKIDPTKIFLFGRSLGGAVAFSLAQYAEQKGFPLAGVVVENTFLSISAMVDHLMPYVAPLKTLVLRIDWNSEKIVPTLTMPIFYLAGGQDQLVPHSHMVQLYKRTKQSRLVRMHVVPDGTHNETWMQGGQDYWDAFASFLQQAMLVMSSSSSSSSSSNVSCLASPAIDLSSSKIRTKDDPTTGTGGSSTISSTSASSSSIPMMPTRILGIARESIRDSNAASSTSTTPTPTPGKQKDM